MLSASSKPFIISCCVLHSSLRVVSFVVDSWGELDADDEDVDDLDERVGDDDSVLTVEVVDCSI